MIWEMHISSCINSIDNMTYFPFRVKTDLKLICVIKPDPFYHQMKENGVLMQDKDIIGETITEIQPVYISLEFIRKILNTLG